MPRDDKVSLSVFLGREKEESWNSLHHKTFPPNKALLHPFFPWVIFWKESSYVFPQCHQSLDPFWGCCPLKRGQLQRWDQVWITSSWGVLILLNPTPVHCFPCWRKEHTIWNRLSWELQYSASRQWQSLGKLFPNNSRGLSFLGFLKSRHDKILMRTFHFPAFTLAAHCLQWSAGSDRQIFLFFTKEAIRTRYGYNPLDFKTTRPLGKMCTTLVAPTEKDRNSSHSAPGTGAGPQCVGVLI